MDPKASLQPVEAPLRISCKAGQDFSISIRDGNLLLAKSNPYDENQQWYRVDISNKVSDDDGYPCFVLINKGTSQVIKQNAPNNRQLQSITLGLHKGYSNLSTRSNPTQSSDIDENAIIWSERHLDNGYKSIRLVHDNTLTWTINGGDDVTDGSILQLHSWNGSTTQLWNLTPWTPLPSLGTPIRLYCKAGSTFYVTIKDGKVILTPYDPNNKYQQWYKHETSTHVDNIGGYSCFALINEATGQAIKYSDKSFPVELIDYFSNNNKSIIWTERNSKDGSKFIKAISNTSQTLDALLGKAQDGVAIGRYNWHGRDNQRWFISRCVTLPNKGMGHPVRVRIYCKDFSHFSIAVENDTVVVAQFDPYDELQAWYMYDVHVTPENNAEDLIPRFVVVNEATGLAIKHAPGESLPVQVISYDPKVVNESTLWTELDFGDAKNYRAIKMFNVSGNLTWDAQSVPVKVGCTLGCVPWHGKNNQLWKIEPF